MTRIRARHWWWAAVLLAVVVIVGGALAISRFIEAHAPAFTRDRVEAALTAAPGPCVSSRSSSTPGGAGSLSMA